MYMVYSEGEFCLNGKVSQPFRVRDLFGKIWCTRQGSNLRPSVSKTGTLPAELRVHIFSRASVIIGKRRIVQNFLNFHEKKYTQKAHPSMKKIILLIFPLLLISC